MSAIVFVMGRPGSGKSQAVRHMRELVLHGRWGSSHITDYALLYQMFHDGCKQFRAREHDSFDVTDFSVLDVVLGQINKILLKEKQQSSNAQQLFFVEFARDDYKLAFDLFDRELLREAYFLFLKADTGTCIDRICKRINSPASLDDHFVSEEIVKGYYGIDGNSYITGHLGRDFDIDSSRIAVIDSNGSWEKVCVKVDEFAEFLLKKLTKPGFIDEASPVGETTERIDHVEPMKSLALVS
jgi:energy-coupling factor transporter ATP-binding protein EcfA2